MKYLLRNIFTFFATFLGIILMSFLFNTFLIKKAGFLEFDDNVTKLILGSSRTEYAINDHMCKNAINMSSSADSYFYTFLKLRTFSSANPELDTIIINIGSRNLDKDLEKRWLKNKSYTEERFSKYCYYLKFNDLKDLFSFNTAAVIVASIDIPKYTIRLLEKVIKSRRSPYDLGIGSYKLSGDYINKSNIRFYYDECKDFDISKLEVKYLKRISKYCTNNNLTLIFLSPPLHEDYNKLISTEEKAKFFNFYNENLSSHQFLDYSKLPLQDSCFRDHVHLNYKGANYFTNYLMKIGLN